MFFGGERERREEERETLPCSPDFASDLHRESHFGEDKNLPDALASHIILEAQNHVSTLDDIPKEERFLLIMVGNGALVDMFRSWLCNTKHMRDVHRRTLILMTDRAGYIGLVKNEHRVHVVDSSLNDTSLEADMSFGTEAYWRITERRVRILGVVLRAGISFLNVEPDAVWAKNPLLDPRLTSSPRDIILTVEFTADIEFMFAFGFLLVRSNRRTNALFSELEEKLSASIASMRDRHHDQGEYVWANELQEQEVLKRLVQSNDHNVTYSCLDQCSYASGRWYIKNDLRKYCRDTAGIPYIINNNWIVGNKAKTDRAKHWGHWFLDDDQECKQHMHQEKVNILMQTLQSLEPTARVS